VERWSNGMIAYIQSAHYFTLQTTCTLKITSLTWLKFQLGLLNQPASKICHNLKGHSHLVHMRIGYHFIANLHITLLHKKRAWKWKWEAYLSKPCQFDVFASQNSACIRVILEEQWSLIPWRMYQWTCRGKAKGQWMSRKSKNPLRWETQVVSHFWFQSDILLF